MEHASWIRDTIEMWVGEYLESGVGPEIESGLRPRAEELLVTFLWQACAVRGVPPGDVVKRDLKEALLEGMQSFPLTEKEQRKVPRIIGDFIADLGRRGRLADGEDLGRYLGALREAFLDSMAAKPKPVVRPSEKIGRNDPCPCGSGRKYKKCCQSLGSDNG